MSRFANNILSMGHGLTQLFTDSFELLVAGGSILDVGCRYKLKAEGSKHTAGFWSFVNLYSPLLFKPLNL